MGGHEYKFHSRYKQYLKEVQTLHISLGWLCPISKTKLSIYGHSQYSVMVFLFYGHPLFGDYLSKLVTRLPIPKQSKTVTILSLLV